MERLQARARRGRSAGERAAALQALLALAPELAEPFIRPWSQGGQRELCCSALMAAVELEQPGVSALLRGAARHPDWAVRLRAIQLAEGVGGPWVLELLLERLRVERRTALRHALVGALQALTGLWHRDHPDAWEAAVRALPPGWTGPPPAGEAASRAARRDSVASIGRLEPKSDHLAILIDFSGSLWFRDASGRSKKEQLDPQVSGLLSRLSVGTRFLLVPYTSEAHPFEPRPVEATRRNVLRAQRFFKGAQMKGSGDLFGALTLALEAPAIDRVVLLTDGAPSGGERWDVGLMIELLKERLRFRPALLDFVLVESSAKLERLWGGLATGSGGRMIALGW